MHRKKKLHRVITTSTQSEHLKLLKKQVSNSIFSCSCRDDPLCHTLPSGQPRLHVHWFCAQQHRPHTTPSHHPGLHFWNLLHPLRYFGFYFQHFQDVMYLFEKLRMCWNNKSVKSHMVSLVSSVKSKSTSSKLTFLFDLIWPSSLSLPPPGLSLVVGLVLYISNINDEMLNRTKTNEAYFSYKYGWSFAFAAISFLLTEVNSEASVCENIVKRTDN